MKNKTLNLLDSTVTFAQTAAFNRPYCKLQEYHAVIHLKWHLIQTRLQIKDQCRVASNKICLTLQK